MSTLGHSSPAKEDGHGKLHKRRIAVVSSLTLSLVNFRLELLKRLVEAGHEVTAYGPDLDMPTIETLRGIGVSFVKIPMARAATNPIQDVLTFVALVAHFRRFKPDVVIPYTMKPIIYGCLAARLAGVKDRYALVTGLGHVFAEAPASIRRRWLKLVSIGLYRAALRGSKRVFVYNDADRDDLLRNGIVRDPGKLILVPGSGVDLERFAPSAPPAGDPTFLLIARLLRDKGIAEFAVAAAELRTRYPRARFQLLGPFDPNPAAISRSEVDAWSRAGALEYLGETRDIRPYLTSCSVFVLPSYYREGIPRSLLEALATGRAIVTTDAPGCRETVIAGENGFLVPTRDTAALSRAMEAFISDPGLAPRMGRRSREFAVQRFDVHAVNRLLLSCMNLDMVGPSQEAS